MCARGRKREWMTDFTWWNWVYLPPTPTRTHRHTRNGILYLWPGRSWPLHRGTANCGHVRFKQTRKLNPFFFWYFLNFPFFCLFELRLHFYWGESIMLQGLLPRTQAQRPVANLQRPLDCCCHKSWQQLVADSLPHLPSLSCFSLNFSLPSAINNLIGRF